MGVVRKTKTVETVLNQFGESGDAISVVNLVERLNQEMNKTTVYRILERLEDDGTVHSFSGKSGLKWYAKCTDCNAAKHVDAHPHFQCQDCGITKCVTVSFSIPSLTNYQIDSAELLLTGRCANCL